MIVKIPFIKKYLTITLVSTLNKNLLDILLKRYKDIYGYWTLSRIEAIKFYRSIYPDKTLGESKNYIDNLIAENNLPIRIYIEENCNVINK